MSVLYAAESWPEHEDDLKTIIVGHCAIKYFGSATKIKTSPADISEINKLVETHPLNETHEQFGVKNCARIIKTLAQENTETSGMTRFKVELLRQVQLYIQRGLSTLRNEPTLAAYPTPQRPKKLTRSQISSVEGNDKQKPEVEGVYRSMDTEYEGIPPVESTEFLQDKNFKEPSIEETTLEDLNDRGSNARESTPKQPVITGPITGEPMAEQPVDEMTVGQLEAGIDLQEADNQDLKAEDDRNPSEKISDLEARQAELHKTREEQRIQEQHERIFRRRARARRSARNTPEPEAQPEVIIPVESRIEPKSSMKEAPKSGSLKGAGSTTEAEKLENNVIEDEKDESESSVSDKEDREGTELEAEQAEPTERDDASSKRKRSVTFGSGQSPLAELLSNLMSHKSMAPFKDTDFHESPVLLSPTSLSAILERIQKSSLGSIEDVQVELLKLVANGVMAEGIDQKQSKTAIAAIDSAISQFREETSENFATPKRKRR